MHDPAALTLRSYYERLYAPTYLVDARLATLDEYAQLVRLWELYTADTPLAAINVHTLAVLKAALLGRRGRRPGTTCSAHTVNKHLRTVNALLGKAGPPGPGNRDALGLVDRSAWTKQCKAPRPRPRPPTSEELGAVYRSCNAAKLPGGARADYTAAWWRTTIVLAYNTALRRQARAALRWSHINWDDCLLVVQAEADKAGLERLKPLSQVVVEHLARLRSAAEVAEGSCDLVFAWPHSWCQFYRQWRVILRASGLPPARWFCLHSLKAAHGSELRKIADPWVVQQSLDHSSLATSRHYVDAAGDVRAAVERLPQPAAFDAAPHDRDRQGRLFDW